MKLKETEPYLWMVTVFLFGCTLGVIVTSCGNHPQPGTTIYRDEYKVKYEQYKQKYEEEKAHRERVQDALGKKVFK